MRKLLAVSALACLSTPAMAIPINFQVGYDVEALDSDPGLVIETLDLLSNPFSFTLDIDGDTSYSADLFRIWTDETTANLGDDFLESVISVAFTFFQPGAGNATATGVTSAATFFLLASWGELEWDEDEWYYDFGDGGLLKISLWDEAFNGGLGLGLTPGSRYGADVKVKFKLLEAPTVTVPEPGTLVLLGAGLLAAAGLGRRRATRA